MFLWTAFLIGLVGSFHCAGMCGPIALSLPVKSGNWSHKVYGGLLYNGGRIFTYLILGAIFGLLGKGLKLGGFQMMASVLIGSLMIIYSLYPLIFRKRNALGKLLSPYSTGIFSKFQRLFRGQSAFSLLGIGILNGILPCGLVYVALAGAVNTGEVTGAMLFMALFGLGTLPVMFSVVMAGTIISLKLRNTLGRITPYVVILLGMLFILRGLSLGIPYVSPKAEALTPVAEKAHKCCQK